MVGHIEKQTQHLELGLVNLIQRWEEDADTHYQSKNGDSQEYDKGISLFVCLLDEVLNKV